VAAPGARLTRGRVARQVSEGAPSAAEASALVGSSSVGALVRRGARMRLWHPERPGRAFCRHGAGFAAKTRRARRRAASDAHCARTQASEEADDLLLVSDDLAAEERRLHEERERVEAANQVRASLARRAGACVHAAAGLPLPDARRRSPCVAAAAAERRRFRRRDPSCMRWRKLAGAPAARRLICGAARAGAAPPCGRHPWLRRRRHAGVGSSARAAS
jgi:hypothetical protein